jgi:HK97 family phage major capsid protein
MELKDISQLIEDQGKAWSEFQKANDARLAAIEAKGYAPSDLTEKVEKINADLADISKQMVEVEKKAGRPNAGKDDPTPAQAEYRKAFGLYLRTGEGDSRELRELGQKAMNTGSDPNGGYLVLPEMDMAIGRVVGTMGGLASIADTITIGTAKWEKLVKTAGMAMRRVADGGTGGETTEPTYANVAIEVFPAEVEPWVFNETLEDSRIDLEADLANEAAIGFAEGANAEYITGNGVGKARGITAYTNVHNSAYAWGSVGYIRAGKTTAFMSVAPSDRLISLQHSLKPQYRPGANFLMNDTTLGVARQMKDASGSYYLWNPDPAAGFGGRFLGSPVTIDDNMPDIGSGAYAVAYGNFKRAYKIVNRSGTTLIRDNITLKGQTKFNFRRRFGGGIWNYEAIKLMVFSTGAA